MQTNMHLTLMSRKVEFAKARGPRGFQPKKKSKGKRLEINHASRITMRMNKRNDCLMKLS